MAISHCVPNIEPIHSLLHFFLNAILLQSVPSPAFTPSDTGLPITAGCPIGPKDFRSAPRLCTDIRHDSASCAAGVPRNAVGFEAAITTCEEKGEWEQALVLLNEMRGMGVTPSTNSFNSAISACAKGGQSKSILSLLAEMREVGMTPDTTSSIAEILACEKILACENDGQWQKATQLLAKMMNAGVPPNLMAFNAAIGACKKGGQWRLALSLLRDMKVAGFMPDKNSFIKAVQACDLAAQPTLALDTFAMGLAEVGPDSDLFDAAFDAVGL